jgi:hypothetical protein
MLLDLRPATVDHHGIHSDQLEQHHVLGEIGLQLGIGHGVAAVLDHHGLAMELADIGQRLGQDLGLVARCNGGKLGHESSRECVVSKLCRKERLSPAPSA